MGCPIGKHEAKWYCHPAIRNLFMQHWTLEEVDTEIDRIKGSEDPKKELLLLDPIYQQCL